ncbi:MAG: penicillin-binding transpeptidase domain-containing protein [Weeksellaceae bacterium]|nr:penicillin-binding transpeptidase domain-containing protein [Weeksellaceae bacterium]
MRKIVLFYAAIIVVVILFIFQLAYLQLGTDRYILNAFNTSIKRETLYPKRGDILDRNGELLVYNSNTYELHITPALLEQGFDTLRFAELLGISAYDFREKMEEIRQIKGYSRVGTYPLIRGLNRDQFTRFQEQMYNYPAIDIVQRPRREYRVNGAGNVLGYIQEVNDPYIATDSLYYAPGDLAGFAGVERSYEKVLRGTKGYRFIKKDIRLRNIGPYDDGKKDVPMINGKTIKLSLDYRIQKYAEELLVNKRGAVVAIEPKTGEILALASAPTIDPNRYNIPGEIWRMTHDSVSKEMFDRSLQATYPPGSPFKLITGLSAMQMGVIDTATTFTCQHGFRYGRRRLGCHCGQYYRPIKIQTAIQKSCNNYFSHTWKKILEKDSLNIDKSINEWHDILESFGLGVFMGVDMPVGSRGNIPDAGYYNRAFGENRWNPYTVISVGIGQGEILTTPIQMANFAAAIANKGWFYTPHIVKEIDGNPIKDSAFTTKRHVKVNPKHFEFILEGMRDAVTGGTGRGIITKKFTQAGKTGTAENPHGQDHSLFTLIAPAEDPQIVVAVVVENAHYGGRWAAPIASLVAELYLTDTIERKALDQRMRAGDMRPEYQRQEIERLKKMGWYVEPQIDSSVLDSLQKIN